MAKRVIGIQESRCTKTQNGPDRTDAGTVGRMSPEWSSRTIDSDAEEIGEQMGSKEKWWVRQPDDTRLWLFKLARVDKRDGTVSGEDWAEWLVHRLAALLDVPTATVIHAVNNGKRGIISRSVLHDDQEYLEHGNSVLSAHSSKYHQSIRRNNPGYTPRAVHAALSGIAPPQEASWPSNFTAFDVWAGYLVLDAWVAGQDRHHENWAVIVRGEAKRLAPSFDHGNALAFQERDKRREHMLNDDRHFQRWVERGKNRYFAGEPKLTDLAFEALTIASPEARAYWKDRVNKLRDEDIQLVVSQVPREILSEEARKFILKLLATTRRRLLDGYANT